MECTRIGYESFLPFLIKNSQLNYNISLARRPFFWVALIIVPTCLICIVALVGIFFAGEGKVVDNAVCSLA